MYSESVASPNFFSQYPPFGDFWNPNPFAPADEIPSFTPPEEWFPQSSSDIRTAPLSSEEQRIFDTALRTFDDLSPSRKLIDTLSWLGSNARVNIKLLMEAVNRQLCLDPNALYYLFKDCMPTMAESAIAQLFREGCCPTLARSIINTAQRLNIYVSPETRDALFNAPLSYDGGFEELRICLTNRASHELDETLSLSEAQRQFRCYAKKIVNKHPPDPWVNDFITLAAATFLDDGVELERPVDQPLTDPQLMEFLTGSWDPEMTSAAELRKIVLNTRKRIHTQYTLAAQPPQSTAAVIAAARSLTSPMIRATFSDIRTFDELSRAEHMVRTSISLLAAAALESRTTARLEDSVKIVPRGDVRGEKPLPLWVIKVRPLLPDKVSITLATPLGSGTFKIFWRVCRLAGEPRSHDISMPVYAYGKLKEASKIRSTINDLRQQQLSALVFGNLTIAATLDQKIQQMLANANRARSDLLNAVDIVRQVGDEIALSPTLAKKTGDPTMVKGIAMACMDGTLMSLETLRMPLKKRLALAITACRLVAQLHDRGFVHLDISCRNFLYKKIGTGIELKLSDLDGAKKVASGYQISGKIGAYPVPETVAATSSHPLTISSSIDNWALGVVVTKIMVGGDMWVQLVAANTETVSLTILHAILRTKSYSVSTAASEPLNGLLQPTPSLRWSARAAADAFQATIESKNRKPAGEEELPPKVRRTK